MKNLLKVILISCCIISCTALSRNEYQLVIYDQYSLIKNIEELQNDRIKIGAYVFTIKVMENENIDNMPIIAYYSKHGFGFTLIDVKTGLKGELKKEIIDKLIDEINNRIKR